MKNHIQGFVTHEGIFLDRQYAFFHARACDQILPDAQLLGSVLTSEDLW
jgi:hypothetical protein